MKLRSWNWSRGTEVPQELRSARSKGALGVKEEWIS